MMALGFAMAATATAGEVVHVDGIASLPAHPAISEPHPALAHGGAMTGFYESIDMQAAAIPLTPLVAVAAPVTAPSRTPGRPC